MKSSIEQKQRRPLQPLISVIVPNYNYAHYLERRLDTILGQTYQNIEVIILDDCSTDNSREVIERYRLHPKVREIVYNTTNSGSPFKQWDKGIHLAAGDLIWIAESDDYCELNFLEELVKAICRKPNCVLAFSSYILFDDEGGKYVPPIHGTKYYSGRSFVSKWMSIECVIRNASGVVFSKSAFQNISKDYTSFKQCGDYMMWILLAEQGYIAYVNKNLTYFRISSSSVTGKNAQKTTTAFEDKLIFDYIDQKYHLSWYKKQQVLTRRYACYFLSGYYNPEIFPNISDKWGFEGFRYHKHFHKFSMKLFNTIRIHLNILI